MIQISLFSSIISLSWAAAPDNNFSPNNKHKGNNRGHLKYYSPKYYNTISILTSNFHNSIKKKKSPNKKTLLANEPKKNFESKEDLEELAREQREMFE